MGTKRKRDVIAIEKQPDTQRLHLKLRMERKRFKNVRVHYSKLPEAPKSRSGRSLSPVAEFSQTVAPPANPHSWSHRTVNVARLRSDQSRKRKRVQGPDDAAQSPKFVRSAPQRLPA